MTQALAIAAGGAVGSVLRFWLSQSVNAMAGRTFPYGTFAVNVIGCLFMGLLFAAFARGGNDTLRLGILVGVLGGFTTFSAFSIDTYQLLQQGDWLKAGANAFGSVIACLAATALGVMIAKQW